MSEEEYTCDRCGNEFTAQDMTEAEHAAREIVCTSCANELLQEMSSGEFHEMYVSP